MSIMRPGVQTTTSQPGFSSEIWIQQSSGQLPAQAHTALLAAHASRSETSYLLQDTQCQVAADTPGQPPLACQMICQAA